MDGGDGFVVGFQIGFLAGEQIAAVAGFGVQHGLQQFAHQCVRALDMGHPLHGSVGALIAGFIDADQQDGRQRRQRQTECDFFELRPAHDASLWWDMVVS